jgi:TM2 domain-containing membrane protein YozV
MASYRNPGTAAVLSLLIPGLGQLYNGKILRAILWFLVAAANTAVWVFSLGTLGWIIHALSAWGAYSYAKKHPYG